MDGTCPSLWLDPYRFRPGALESDESWSRQLARIEADYPPRERTQQIEGSP